jgi:hypothetical protein
MKIRPIPKVTSSNSMTARDGRCFRAILDLTLAWKPETDLTVVAAADDVASHALAGGGVKVRVIARLIARPPDREAYVLCHLDWSTGREGAATGGRIPAGDRPFFMLRRCRRKALPAGDAAVGNGRALPDGHAAGFGSRASYVA